MKQLNKRYILHDGTILSIQASEMHYSTPRNNIGPYTKAEVWIVRGRDPEGWEAFQDGIGPNWDYGGEDEGHYYGYVPIYLIEKLIADLGGINLGAML